MLLTHVVTEHVGISSGASGMALAVEDKAVAGDHGQGTGNSQLRNFRGYGVNNDHAALLAVFLKSFLGQTLPGFYPLQVLISDSLSLLPARAEEGRAQVSHGGGVGIALSGHVQPMLAGPL